MYVGIFRIAFAVQKHDISDWRAVKSVCEKIMARFKVIARSNYSDPKSDLLWIGITTLAEHEEALEKMFEQISELCDGADLGRVYDQSGVVERFEDMMEDIEMEKKEYEP